MDTLKIFGKFSIKDGNTSKIDGDCTVNYSKTGSNSVSYTRLIDNATYQALTTSSLNDVRYMYFANNGTGSMTIYRDGSGANTLTTLQPNDHSVIAWSGSIGGCPLWAKAHNSASILYYIITEA
jgi:hypothetical protein